MPVSEISSIPAIITEVCRLNPRSVLDLGIGFGKYGVLLREKLDIEPGRIHQRDWLAHIDGVEGFAQYANPCWKIYDNVMVEDFIKEFTTYKNYDLVMMIDSLEHVDKPMGELILDTLMTNNKRVIVSCPTGDYYQLQGAVNDNEFERHRAHWTPDDFTLRGGKIIHHGICVAASLKGLYIPR